MRTRVAFQGERGAYGEIAALQYFPSAELIPLKSFQDVFCSAQDGDADFAIVPVENSIEGSVNEIYDLLLQTKMRVEGEVYQRVRHCLIGKPGAKKSAVKRVYSHPHALAQCRGYLQKNNLEAMPSYDTAGAVKLIKQMRLKGAAAIASKRAAELYHMQVLEEEIQDRKNNYTRFLALSSKRATRDPKPGQFYKTSIIFSVRHVPGALFGILGEFSMRNINLTKVESRPTKETPWEYNFYVDFEGHMRDSQVNEAILSITTKTSCLKILGSYKRAEFR